MNDNERKLLSGFLGNLQQAKVNNRDPEADAMIREAVARQPDAAYLLVQQALMQQAALSRAQARPAAATPSTDASAEQPVARGGWSNTPRPGSQPPVQARPEMGRQAAGGGAGDFMRSAAATAVGVAGGAMLFQGLSGLFGGDDAGGGEEGGFLGGDAPIDSGDALTDAAAPTEDPVLADPGIADEPPMEADDGLADDDGGLFGGFDPFGDDGSDWG